MRTLCIAVKMGCAYLCVRQVVQPLLDMRSKARPQVHAADKQSLHDALHLGPPPA